ncbi:glyoxalase superfamily protein [Aurantimonas marina]|uniref:glyoxalase superfamily protein n=1 Tax=Aurantimonas marina TaxID=2780508 RepID=UPI0019D1BD09|nr:glyoxalase superfamily protein [Aurantimonas marina]
MTGIQSIPTVDTLKAQAKRLRAGLEQDGHTFTHSATLELVARQHGFRDWNTLHASAEQDRTVADLLIGSAVAGRYLGQRFTGELIALQRLSKSGRFRATIQFDAPVDVVAFESFSAFRRRVTVTIDAVGATAEKTSDGRPHLELTL